MVRINDSAQARGGGVLGRVFLYRTLPYERTERGGIALPVRQQDRFRLCYIWVMLCLLVDNKRHLHPENYVQ